MPTQEDSDLKKRNSSYETPMQIQLKKLNKNEHIARRTKKKEEKKNKTTICRKGDKILKQMQKLTKKLQARGYKKMVQKGYLSTSMTNIYTAGETPAGGGSVYSKTPNERNKKRLQSAVRPKKTDTSLISYASNKRVSRMNKGLVQTNNFINPISYDVKEHKEFCNLTLYLNDYQRMREGSTQKNNNRNKTRNGNRQRGFDLDFESYKKMKVQNTYSYLYKTDVKANLLKMAKKYSKRIADNDDTILTEEDTQQLKQEIKKIKAVPRRDRPILNKSSFEFDSTVGDPSSNHKRRPHTSKVFESRRTRLRSKPADSCIKPKSGLKLNQSHNKNNGERSTASNLLLKSVDEVSPLGRTRVKKRMKRAKTKGLSKKPHKIIQMCKSQLDDTKLFKKKYEKVIKNDTKTFTKLKIDALKIQSDIVLQNFLYSRMKKKLTRKDF
ncbi:unnamed protein product [Moneuplotes crassus]|uniref:Uncharacterized protein n=1 Tax=Euplotes crassus TaxID=5936 RepID=A0AAD1TYM5_EUPCR|nr:unnamed protein product [Moneuplotes crassus]